MPCEQGGVLVVWLLVVGRRFVLDIATAALRDAGCTHVQVTHVEGLRCYMCEHIGQVRHLLKRLCGSCGFGSQWWTGTLCGGWGCCGGDVCGDVCDHFSW